MTQIFTLRLQRSTNGPWYSMLGPVGPKSFEDMVQSENKVLMMHHENPPFMMSRDYWNNDETLFQYDVVNVPSDPGTFWEAARDGMIFKQQINSENLKIIPVETQ